LGASARQRRGCGKTVPPVSAAGSGGPLFPGCRFFFCPLFLWTSKEKMDIVLLKNYKQKSKN